MSIHYTALRKDEFKDERMDEYKNVRMAEY